jgi:hypothetical protein
MGGLTFNPRNALTAENGGGEGAPNGVRRLERIVIIFEKGSHQFGKILFSFNLSFHLLDGFFAQIWHIFPALDT